MSKKRKEQKVRERNISKSALFQMFEQHQLESLGDIAIKYRKLESSLGYRQMKFQEYLPGGTDGGTDALYHLQGIIKWKLECVRLDLDYSGTELLARDNLTISSIVRYLSHPKHEIILHAQCCLTVWSISVNRCSSMELIRIRHVLYHDPRNKN